MKKVILLFIFILIMKCYVLGQQSDRMLFYIPYSIKDQNLKIVDEMTNTEVARIPLANTEPGLVALSADNKLAFMANTSSVKPGMFVVDLEKQMIIKTMFDNDTVYGLNRGPDNQIYILLGKPTNQVVIVNSSTLQISKIIPTIKEPLAFAFSPSGTQAYVGVRDIDGNDFLIIDLKTLSITNNIAGLKLGLIGCIAISPDGHFAYVGQEKTISVIDLVSNKITQPLPGTLLVNNLQVSLDGNTLYAIDFSPINPDPLAKLFLIIDIPTKSIVKKFPVITGQRYLQLTPDGKKLYIGSLQNGIDVLDTQTKIISSYRPQDEKGFGGSFILVKGQLPVKPATINITSPQTGDIVQKGQSFTIKWQTTAGNNPISNHKVSLSTNGGTSFTDIATNLSATTQQLDFTFPNNFVQNAQIRVAATDSQAIVGTGISGIFTIGDKPNNGDTQAPMVRFLNPLGNEQFKPGDTINITWSSSDNVGVTAQDLTLSTDGGTTFPLTIATGLAGNVQNFNYQIPSTLQTTQGKFSLVVRDQAGNMATATTPNSFQIQAPQDMMPPTVTISSPSGNSLIAGSPITVNWQSIDNVGVTSQALLLSFDGGTSFQNVANFDGTTSSFILNNIAGLDRTVARARVKITAMDAMGNKGEQTASFTLTSSITQATYTKPNLSITGIGFTSTNTQATVNVLINGKVVNVKQLTFNGNTSIAGKGNKKKLGLVKGANSLKVVVDGIESNTVNFNF